MNRIVPVLLAVLLGVSGCKCKDKIRVETTEESGTTLASTVHVADPQASVQLLKGFHEVEQNAWRWTTGRFSVTLRPPIRAAEKGATLQVKFALPEAVIDRVKSTTLTANVNGAPLAGETYSKPGDYTYSRDVPASALAGDAVTAEFALNKFLPPGAVDQRELGIVVSSIGLEPK
ncbi:MAG: hypothetical protein HYZ57_10555 [Acidobacteria bacterium]|nr:hypothetical protein [Acidobacteriota bacterium]